MRDELLSLGQLEQHAKVLAGLHEVDPRPGRDRLRARLADNEALLLVTHEVVSEASRQNRRLTPAAEWLLDNFHLLEEQIRTARQHLPKAYSRQLPRLRTGLAAGFPRVYDIALELISHADGLVDSEHLNAFIRSYQTVAHLELGELWAVPIMLRLALIENVRRVAARMASGRRDRDRADDWAHRMLDLAEREPGNLVLVLADMVRAKPALTGPFVAEFVQHLQGRSPSLNLSLTWLEQRLAEQGQSVESVVEQENQTQAADQVSIGNSISSLRFLASADWREFVEAASVVEHTLRGDPAGVYAAMDFATRDRYRHAVEELTKDSGVSEEQVAQAAIDMARQYPVGPDVPRETGSSAQAASAPEAGQGSAPTGHVGYYLVGKGRVLLERAVGVQLTPKLVLQRVGRRHALPIYAGTILMITGAITAALLLHGRRYGLPGYELALLLLPLLVVASHFGVAITNWLATLLAKPRHIPRVDFSRGIPIDCQTLVVVPAMLTSIPAVAELLDALEIRFLGNLQPNLHFGLLTDFLDAASEHLPGDAGLLSAAIDGIEALNTKYASRPFFLFHRSRRWNPQEGVWMGWERKRGKLADLNTLLRGNGHDRFSVIVGDASVLRGVRYVITLDTDTQLPPNTAHQLIGAMAHPLNRPVFDASRNVVVEGYGVLQPRVGTTLISATRSRFARMFASDAGMDPYTRVVSNVYQDVFGEGSFIGKGIYDVDVFERALGGRFPENRILSHDLLEGGYARCGLVSDCLLFESFPRHYLADVGRRHRWMRGDWQIASWILPSVPGPGTVPIPEPDGPAGRVEEEDCPVGVGARQSPFSGQAAAHPGLETGAAPCTVPNPLSGISRWKVFDNLRRSLVPVAVVVLLAVAWLAGPRSAHPRGLAALPLYWTLWTLALLLGPVLLGALSELLRRPPDLPLGLHTRWAIRSAGRHLAEAVFSIACLPFEACLSADAIMRTLIRLRRRQSLLEWRTAGDAERAEGDNLGSLLQAMIVGPVLAGGLVIILLAANRDALVAAGPLAALWMVGPIAAWSLGWRLVPRPPRLREDQRRFLRGNARRTWRFFETFVTPAENWLPPDNYQEHPAEVTAHRTSPTNIGLALLANLAAFDFGYVSLRRLLERSTGTLESMGRLQEYRGHLLNWYNTLTLEPLPPQYVSTVDSGNLWGALVVLRHGLLRLPDSKILPTRTYEGLQDTLRVLSQEAERAAHIEEVGERPPVDVPARIQRLQRDLDHAPASLSGWHRLLQHLTVAAAELTASLGAGGEETASQDAEQRGLGALRWWAQAFHSQCRDLHDDLALLSPWSMLSWPPEAAWRPAEPGEQAQKLGELLEVVRGLEKIPTLRQVAQLDSMLPIIDALLKAPRESGVRELVPAALSQLEGGPGPLPNGSDFQWLEPYRQVFKEASQRAAERIGEIEQLGETCEGLADMDFDFLYDHSRHLLAIGYNVTDRRRDPSYYDLLASEARLGSYLAIAHRKLPYEHWFRLSRLVTTVGGEPVLLSWSGSMFEYLMPLLFMPTYGDTLLDETCQGVVRRQIEYGRQSGVPWGISESAYNTTDQHLNYQYRAFGVPGLGFKRGLSDDLVVAPYATQLALLIDPQAACRNLERLGRDGQIGRFGFYEAVDYTPSRVPRGQTHATIRSFMAHHQGMTLLSLAHCLLDRPMQHRFLADPAVRACELLLQERIPRIAPVFPHVVETGLREAERAEEVELAGSFRIFNTPHTPVPEVHLLSNGRYHVMISAAGGGYSRWKDLAVSRWRADPTQDNWGSFCYVRDPQRDRFWSTTYQPTLRDARRYEAIFSQARAEFRRRDDHLDIHTEISVSPEDDIELRRVTITNQGRERRAIELTSYAEVTLLPPAAEATHPAFANLFVQTEIFPSRRAILCTRRPRSKHEHSPWMFHLMASHGIAAGEASYETARDRFIGRGRTLIDPAAMHVADLSNSEGAVLDPIVSVRRMVTLEPDQSVQLDIVTGVTENRDQALALIEKYHDHRLADRVFELAWTHKQVVLRQLQATEADAQLYGRLVGSILYPSPPMRAPAAIIARSNRGQSGLWGYGISGDLPIVLVRVSEKSGLGLVRQMVQAHAYWRLRGLAVDLVIWNEDHSTYRQELQDGLVGLISAGFESQFLDRPGGIFVRRIEQISEDDKALIQTAARAIITDTAGSLAEQIQAVQAAGWPEASRPPRLSPLRPRRPEASTAPPPPTKGDLAFFNGLGGFTPDGREYYVTTSRHSRTPAPWANVMGNPGFGTVVTESGGGYTWAENAHEFRLTPWSNDPVTDVSGEHLYLRDEDTGRFWSPAPLPAPGRMPYTTRHGFGYSVFEHTDHGISSELSTYIATDAPVKFFLLKVRNTSGRSVRLSLTGFVEWVLGEQRSRNMMHVVTELHPGTGAILARNPYNSEFPDRVAFFNASEMPRTVTGSREEFLGRNGSYGRPAAMERRGLSGSIGPGLDPCAAMQVGFELADNGEREIVFVLGAGRSMSEAEELIQRYRSVGGARQALEGVWAYWNRTLGEVHIETPDRSVDFLVNGWLLYQVLSCRYWARSGFYQSGGAYGFRDQLQDVLALVHAEPRLIREHLLRCAAHQFQEGDVQHWWHPPLDRGVRTRISDDYLWLPLVTAQYVHSIGDTGVLDEQVPFLAGRPVKPDEDGYYDLPTRAEETATLYEHCVRAIRNGLKFGEHGLPLMGTGDWNDGMNLVGAQGRGESVWLAFFLHDVLTQFERVARLRNDIAFAELCTSEATKLAGNIEQHAWDGDWYRRAYFDDGAPLGSAPNPECQIDSLPQSWAVLSRAGDPAKCRRAMEQVYQRLVRPQGGLIQLFDPPFDASHLDPGYVKGYPPGVRENGGQYTHAAVWTAMAFAGLGEVQRAWELLRMINPIHHGDTAAAAATYCLEPYVLAGDVYTNPQHVGRGGWSWYTGAAGWTYRLILESLLGLQLHVDRLYVRPLLPEAWNSFQVHYRYRETVYHITVRKEAGAAITRVTVDGAERPDRSIQLIDDRQHHAVEVLLGR